MQILIIIGFIITAAGIVMIVIKGNKEIRLLGSELKSEEPKTEN